MLFRSVFLEVHEEPTRAKSDAQNALRLDLLEPLLRRLAAIDAIVKQPAAPNMTAATGAAGAATGVPLGRATSTPE